MIRIKCPKCSFPLAVEDDQAGKPSECTQCGSKFRVPAPKAKDEADEKKSRRRRDDDDDDEDNDDDLPARPRRRIKRWRISQLTMMNLRMAGLVVLFGIALFVGGMFIKNMGPVTAVMGLVLYLGSLLMVVAHAWRENPVWVAIIWIGQIVCGIGAVLVFVYILLNWQDTKKYMLAAFVGWLIVIAGLISYFIYLAKAEVRREIIRQRIALDERASRKWEAADHYCDARSPSTTVAPWVAAVPVPGRLDDAPQFGVTRPPA